MTMKRRPQPIYAETYQRRYHLRWVAGVLLLLALVGWLFWRQVNRNPRPSESQYPVMGVLLEQSDGVQNFAELNQAGAKFAYLKATEGASYFDDQFNTNYDRGQGGPVVLGVYHYFSFDSSPEAQLAHFKKQVDQRVGQLPIGVYLEYYGTYQNEPPAKATLIRQLQRFIDLLAATYHKPVVLMGMPAILSAVKTVSPTSLRWVISHQQPKQAGFWQYTTGAKLPGGSDSVYQSAVFTGDEAAFNQLTANQP